MIGRGAEQARLTEVLRAIEAGQQRIVRISGGSGSGKTMLTDWMINRRRPATRVARLDCWATAHGAPIPDAWALDANAGSAQLLVLDDLRHADDAALDAVRAMVFAIRDLSATWTRTPPDGVGLVIVDGSDPSAPLDADHRRVRDAIRREGGALEIELGPLNTLEIFEMVHRRLGRRPAPHFVDDIERVSGGNPGRIVDVLDHVRTGRHVVSGLDGVRSSTPLAALPSRTSHQAAIEDRLDKLGEGERRFLDAAACAGPSGPFSVLGDAWDDRAPGDFDDVIDALTDAGVLDEDGDRFWFVDPELREVVYHRLPVRRRQQLHAGIAGRALARQPDRAEAVAVFRQAQAAGAKLAPDLLYGAAIAAADAATDHNLWSVAASALEAALQTEQAAGEAEVDLLLRAGEALFQHLAVESACARYAQARERALACGDRQRAAQAMVRDLYVRVYAAMPAPHWDISDIDDPAVRGWHFALQANLRFAEGALDEGYALCQEATRFAREAGVAEVEARAANAVGLQHLARLDLGPARRSYEASIDAANRCSDPLVRIWPESRLALIDWLEGDVRRAHDRATAAARTADEHSWWGEAALAHGVSGLAAMSTGYILEAERSGERATQLTWRSSYGPQFALPLAMSARVGAAAFRGDPRAVDETLSTWEELGKVPALVRQLAEVMLGGSAERPARTRYDAVDVNRSGNTVLAVELADWTDDDDLAAANLEPLLDLRRRGVANVVGWPVPVTRAAAVAAWRSGDRALALDLLEAGAVEAARTGAVVAAALVAFDRARWQHHGEARLRALVDAVRSFDRLGLAAWAARAQREIDREPDIGVVLPDHSNRVLLYTDLVGSTSLNVRVGDERFLLLVAEHQALVDQCAGELRGVRFHNTGDGFGLWFARVDDALDCALTIHHRMREATDRHPEMRLECRIGIAAGNPIPFDGDLYGTAVVRAARVCQLAGAGEVLAGRDVLDLHPEASHRFRPHSAAVLKGFPESTELFQLAAAD